MKKLSKRYPKHDESLQKMLEEFRDKFDDFEEKTGLVLPNSNMRKVTLESEQEKTKRTMGMLPS